MILIGPENWMANLIVTKSLGYMLILVKPGSAFSSVNTISLSSLRKVASILAKPLHSVIWYTFKAIALAFSTIEPGNFAGICNIDVEFSPYLFS